MAQVLQSIKAYPIAAMQCEEITSADIVALATEVSDGIQPQTVGNYISHLAGYLRHCRPCLGHQA